MTTTPVGLTPTECVRLLTVHRWRWMVPTLVCAILATTYALLMTRYWEASQALVVRQEVSGSSSKQPGKFADLYEMRTFQETILELVKSREVLSATLKQVEKEETGQDPSEPSIRKIEKFRKLVDMRPPGGAEFGKTEIFYLSVKDKSRDRAVRLVEVLCHQLDLRLRQLRDDQAQGLIAELAMQVELANAAHDAETAHLMALESEVGPDLGELRMLNAASSGQSDLRQEAVDLEAESRRTRARVREAEQLLDVLRAALQDPQQLIAMPNSLLESQPTLRRLKDGLVDAQLRAARLGGTRTANHPQVQASIESVKKIRKDLHGELQVAVKGVEIELGLSRDRAAVLEKQSRAVQQRLSRLAEYRAGYANRVSAVENSRAVLDRARKQLGEVRAMQVVARTTSLITPVDRPEVGANPVGLGRTAILAVGTFGGLVLGLGCVFLTVGPSPAEPIRPTERVVQPDAVMAPMPPAQSEVTEPSTVCASQNGREPPVNNHIV